MGRSEASNLRRRTQRKEERDKQKAAVGDDIFGKDLTEAGTSEFDQEPSLLPPGLQAQDEDEDDEKVVKSDKKIKKKIQARQDAARQAAAAAAAAEKGGIKTLPLIMLLLLTGTAVIPGLLYAGDYISGFLANNNVLGSIGFRLGIGAVPRKRVLSFYEKHDPSKIDNVPSILSKHYGDYPKLIKKLERKYQDYGYFVGWEDDEAPVRMALEQLQTTYQTWVTSYWNRYAPQVLKTAARNIRYNLTFLYKRGRKVWKRHVWPTLEPFLGVPKGTEKQKRADAAEARKRRPPSGSGTRRKNTDFRDDVEDEDHGGSDPTED